MRSTDGPVTCSNCLKEGPFTELIPFVPRYTASRLGASGTGDRRERKTETVYALTAFRCSACAHLHFFAPSDSAD